MKKIIGVVSLLVMGSICSCGSFKTDEKELERQKRIEDSLMEIERNDALNDADRILREQDSIAKIRQDSIDAAAAAGSGKK